MNRHTFHALRYVCPCSGLPETNAVPLLSFPTIPTIYSLYRETMMFLYFPLLLCSLYSQPSLCSLCSLCSRISRVLAVSCSLCSLLSGLPVFSALYFATANDDDVRSRQALCSLRCSSATTGRVFGFLFVRPPCMLCFHGCLLDLYAFSSRCPACQTLSAFLVLPSFLFCSFRIYPLASFVPFVPLT